MALSQVTLTAELLVWLSGKSSYTTPLQSATAFAAAFKNYYKDAQDFSGDSIQASTLTESILTGILAPALTLPGLSATAAAGFGSGISAMCAPAQFGITTPPLTLSSESLSVTLTPPSASSITNDLTAVFNNVSAATDLVKAAAIAAAIHPACTATTVSITGVSIYFPFPVVVLTGGIS